MMKKNCILALIHLIFIVSSYSQNEFYINGALVKIQAGALLHVQGDFHLDNEAANNGRLDNDGEIELRGDFIIDNSNVEQTGTAEATSSGLVRFKNFGYATETSHQNESQRIDLLASGVDALGVRAFYRIEIENDNQTNSISAIDNYVDIVGGDVEITNKLIFNNDSRLVTDDAGSIAGNDGSEYSNEVYVSNDAIDAIEHIGRNLSVLDYRAQAGDNVKYIEGKLSRQVSGSGLYFFPIGIQPNILSSDGMQAFSLNVSGAVNQKVSSYLNSGTDATAMSNQNIYNDVGEDPGPGSDPFSLCIGDPDGIQDYIFLNDAQSHEWQIDNDGADFSYDIEIYPGPGLNNTSANAINPYNCGSNNFVIRFLAKDGDLYNRTTGTLLTTQPAPHPFNTANFPDGYYYSPPNSVQSGNVLNNLSSFSSFRIHGATDIATVLPVTWLSMSAYPVNNQFIQVAWSTLSELNNHSFEIERSIDAVSWTKIGEVDGAGTTYLLHDYTFNDETAEYNITYYYRIKQVDFDGSAEYFGLDEASLVSEGFELAISEFTPSPASQFSEIQISSPTYKQISYIFYNGLGQIIREGNIEIEAGNTQTILAFNELDQLAASTYFLTLTDGSDVFLRTLVKY